MSIHYIYNFPQVARDAGFKLRQYKDGPVDWREISSLEVGRVLRDQNLEQIDGMLNHLSEAPLSNILESNILDSGIAKYFALSQLSIQYLLFCRKFLSETVKDFRESHVDSQMEFARVKKLLTEANNEILQLNKKLTQVEALHEVIYPCHLCSKSFINNESLNIHITRKHPNKQSHEIGKVASNPSSGNREREYDLTLINTIKLELEIKQLKERLNAAERLIKESSFFSNNAGPVYCNKEIEKTMISIGIQSNLSEKKEEDETTEICQSPAPAPFKELIELQVKIQEFDEWKDLQKDKTEEIMTNFNTKLLEIAETLENWKIQTKASSDQIKDHQKASVDSKIDVERLLSEKVIEISKANARKLEDVLNKMQLNYKTKLTEMENDFKLHISSVKKSELKDKNSFESIDISSKQTPIIVEKNCNIIEKNENEILNKKLDSKSKIPQRIQTSELLLKAKKPCDMDKINDIDDVSLSTSESNRTFIKTSTPKENIRNIQVFSDRNESTDEIESITNDEAQIDKHHKPPRGKTLSSPKHDDTPVERLQIKEFKPEPKKPVSRKDVKKMFSKSLLVLGFSHKTKGISNLAMKRAVVELQENRNKLKQKYPHFNATRNNIKKCVEKLCSTHLPEHAKNLLKITQPLQPMEAPKKHNATFDKPEMIRLNSDLEIAAQKESEQETLKQRLEKIFASPMRRPSLHDSNTAIVQIHSMPVPVPRKRVMFNTVDDKKEIKDAYIEEHS